jgi:hypothetical protein
LDSNRFSQNVAFKNGLAVFIKDSSSDSSDVQIRNNFYFDHSVASKNQIEGSVLVLEDAGNISILNCVFKNNFGISGTCLSYSETSNFFITGK